MKNKILILFAVILTLVGACQKNDMMNNPFDVDVENYENTLGVDYSNALFYHNSLNSTSADTLYAKRMFNSNDSLFSEHFYEFCVDMMQNSGMMSSSDGMMGNNSGMMGGNGAMMNGSIMGSIEDMNEMMYFMDSLHHSTQSIMNPNYMYADSLMHNQMKMCNMMTFQTDSIEILFGNMQTIRRDHKAMHVY
ncbi:MAG: hypothetical protein M0P66_10665 [Salinivirgaceae bacterium]|nr:hypothetical protein [Salinivirgaceae bacterium]